MKGNRHQRHDNHSGSADYQHAPEEKDMDLLVVFITFFFKEIVEKKIYLLG